jgi:myo-inositol-1(or 4)-monophosphatase
MTLSDSPTLVEVLGRHELLPLAWRAADAAGRFLKDERPAGLKIDTKSTPTDVVTAMDRNAEAMISTALLRDRQTDGLLGEEGGERLGTSGVRWIVDPLDGTVNYLFNLPMWGVSIAAEVDGIVEVGVVATPEFDEAYVGIRGQGAWLVRAGTTRRLQVSDCSDLSTALVATGFGYAAQVRYRQSEVVTSLIRDVRDVRRLGAAVVDFCWLARGRLDAYYERGLNAWDYAAGALIAEESGAVVTGLHDDDISTFVVAAAPGIAADLRTHLVTLRADEP